MWRMTMLTKKWYWETRLELWRFKWHHTVWHHFDCTGWALPPTNAQRNTMVRLGPDIYVMKLRIGKHVWLRLWTQPNN